MKSGKSGPGIGPEKVMIFDDGCAKKQLGQYIGCEALVIACVI